jgi:hypothetical protein
MGQSGAAAAFDNARADPDERVGPCHQAWAGAARHGVPAQGGTDSARLMLNAKAQERRI